MLHQHLTEIMASILIVGIALQWIGWRFKIPALILLIIAGFIMGPITGWINPKEDFGNMLHPFKITSHFDQYFSCLFFGKPCTNRSWTYGNNYIGNYAC